jgi:valyl-tRNA synthetase
VTGTLHMGHAFNQTIMDALTRYHRMSGHNTLWVPGTDHAGIATQIVVERQLQEQGQPPRPGPQELRGQGVGMEGTVRQHHHHADAPHGRQRGLEHEYFTMDDKLSTVVTETFVRLHQQGLIYRGKRLVNWDPVLMSRCPTWRWRATEEDGSLWHITYPFADGPQVIDGVPQR